MLPIPIILVISVAGIVVTAIIIESIYVSIRNVIQKYKKNKLARKYEGETTTPNPIIEL
jgi:hydrogenase-4 membrane subunit HyfE